MSHVPCLSFVFCFCFVVFSVHSNCSEIWGLSTPNTIEQWDTSGVYSYPDQTRWLFSTIVWLLHTTLMWESCHYNVEGDRHWEHICFVLATQSNPSPFFPSLTWPFPLSPLWFSYPSHFHLLFAVQSDPWTAACRSPTGRAFPMLSTAACGGGRTSTATTSCAPSRPVSMPSTSRRMRSASTPTTTRGWRPQVRWRLSLKTSKHVFILQCGCFLLNLLASTEITKVQVKLNAEYMNLAL